MTETAQNYRLAKSLGLIAIVASAVTQEYGAGINFVVTQSIGVYPAIGDLVPLAMFVTGIVIFLKVDLYARFSRAMPRAGSSYVWTVRALNLPLGFILHFVWWASITAAMGFIAFAFGTFLGNALISAGIPAGHTILTRPGHVLIGLAAIWIVYSVHVAGVRDYGRFVTLLLILVALAALAVCIVGFSTAPADFIRAAVSRTGIAIAAPIHPMPFSPHAFLAVCTLFIFAYGGLSAAPALSGETRDASTTMPRGIVLAWIASVVLFTLVAAALFHAVPWWAAAALIHGKHAALVTAPGIIGLVAPHALAAALGLVIALIVGKTLAPQMVVTSRMVFAWAEDGLIPAIFVNTSRRRAPVAALTLTAILASLFLLQATYIGWAFGVVDRSITILLVWLAVAVAALNLRLNPRFAATSWAQPFRTNPLVTPVAILSIIVTVTLIRSVIVLPHAPIYVQPLFQGAVMAAIGAALYLRAKLANPTLSIATATLPLE
ncbi:APC family permease [Acidiphilium sp. AL]|uniref:APC family permease n=1 Tax=Acidiphilium sp. AL TaxID=2871704 RepID=UPI0021CB7B33|nr:APC family permease [Acidiphilium sp. AL]MCU4160654.1 APC family permease [Acidiphilium sp. AL]